MLHLAYLIPLLPLGGFALLLAFGRRLGNPIAGWIATRRGRRRLRRRGDRLRVALRARPRGAGLHPALVHLVHGRSAQRRRRAARRPAVHDDGAVRHRRRRAHPPLLDRLHGARRGLRQVLHLPQPLRVLDADAGAGEQPARHLLRLGGRRRLLVPARRVLVPSPGGGERRQEGVHLQPHRRRGFLGRAVPHLRAHREPRLLDGLRPARAAARPRTSSRSRSCSSSAPSASRRRSRCSRGWPTPWRARPRSRP